MIIHKMGDISKAKKGFFKFICNRCGCEYSATYNEVTIVTTHHISGIISKEVKCKCPTCCNINYINWTIPNENEKKNNGNN